MEPNSVTIERVQTGIRVEKRLLKVLKALAEHKDLTLGDLIEGIVLHAFHGKCAFEPDTIKLISEFSKLYNLNLTPGASHKLKEKHNAKRGNK